MRRTGRIRARATRLFVAACLITGSIPLAAGAAPAATVGTSTKTRVAVTRGEAEWGRPSAAERVAVQWAPGLPDAQVAAAGERLGFKVVSTAGTLGWTLVEPTRKGVTPAELASALRRSRLAKAARPDRVYKVAEAPADPLFGDQWALHNVGQTGGVADADIDAPEAWTRTKGSDDVVVAVLDTGVDVSHPDLAGNVWTNPGEIPGNDRDDDGNGYEDDVHGYDFSNYDSSVYDETDGDQHGTHVAGIIGAEGENGVGISGVSQDVSLMVVKAFGPWGGGEYELAEALVYAVDNGADLINCSWGGYYSELIEEAVEYARSKGVLIVAAAGNYGEDNDGWDFYPASSESTNVIAVAATDADDELAWFSNYGMTSVDLAAPGDEVTSTLPPESVGLYVDTGQYRVAYLALAVEALEPAVAADELIGRAMGTIAPDVTVPVLLVDDSMPVMTGETAGVRASRYTAALGAVGYTDVTVWSTEVMGTPSTAQMDGKAVVWFTGADSFGWYVDPVLSWDERAVLGEYLDGGGRLLLASGEAATDLGYWEDDPYWLEYYLHARSVMYDTMTFDFQGAPGTAFEGIEVSLPGIYRQLEQQPWPAGSDSIVAADEYATPILRTGSYAPLSGTSMAAPHVSGAAALLMSAMPTATPETVRARLEGTVDRLPSLAGKVASGGRLNADAAFGAFAGAPGVLEPTEGTRLAAGTEAALRWRDPAGSALEATHDAELGLPVTPVAEGFESGTLDGFDTVGEASWVVTSGSVYEGGFAAHSGSIPGTGTSSLQTTITVPSGGGMLAFQWWLDIDEWYGGPAYLTVDDTIKWFEWWPSEGWQLAKVNLPEGQHVLRWTFLKDEYAIPTGRDALGLDDIRLYAHEFSPLLSAGAGVSEATYTVPSVDAYDARIRVRSGFDGRSSAWSYVDGLRITTDLTAPGAPTGLAATASPDGGADLSWTNPPDAASIRVLRRIGTTPTAADDASATVVLEELASSATDAGLLNGADVRYAVYAFDEAGNVSPPAALALSAVDTVGPAPVRALEAAQGEGVVTLEWMNPLRASFDAVRVLRRTDTTPTGPNDAAATVVFEGLGVATPDWLLAREPYEGPAYYGVWAQDASGNRSPGAFVSLQVDTKGPYGRMTVAGGEEYVTTATVTARSWVTDAVQMRFNRGREWDAWEAYAPSKSVQLLPIEGVQTLLAEYRDEFGNVLSLSDEVYVDLRAPEAPGGLAGVPWNSGVRLDWDYAEAEDVVGYNVYESAAGGAWQKVTPDYLDWPSFTRLGLVAGRQYAYKVTALDWAGHESVRSAAVTVTPGEGVVRRAGTDRFNTALEVSRAHWQSADAVVLATGRAFADALASAGLAGSLDAPVLLTSPTALTPGINAEIARLGAKKVYVIGGTAAVSATAAASLPSTVAVTRIAGADRYETALLVAKTIAARERTDFAHKAFVVNGTSFADASAVGPLAYSQRIPILLVRPTSVPATVTAWVDSVGIEEAYGVGSGYTPWRPVGNSLGVYTEPLRGADRYETAALVAEFGFMYEWVTPRFLGIASGRDFPDALTGGIAAGREGGAMLLTGPDTLPDAAFFTFMMWGSDVDKVEIFGGPGAVSEDVADEVRFALDIGGGGWDDPFPPEDEEDW